MRPNGVRVSPQAPGDGGDGLAAPIPRDQRILLRGVARAIPRGRRDGTGRSRSSPPLLRSQLLDSSPDDGFRVLRAWMLYAADEPAVTPRTERRRVALLGVVDAVFEEAEFSRETGIEAGIGSDAWMADKFCGSLPAGTEFSNLPTCTKSALLCCTHCRSFHLGIVRRKSVWHSGQSAGP